VAHRETMSLVKVKRFADEDYWGRAVPGFGDLRPRLLVVGLAPAAHGANRTGRMFTGDRSGEWLFEAMHRFGFANQPVSRDRKDGLRLRGAYVTNVARCAPPANKPTREEIDACRPFLLRELDAFAQLKVVIGLGRIAFDGFVDVWRRSGREVPTPRPHFGHGSESVLSPGLHMLGSYHPSQQNTFTGRLTRPMFHAVFDRARTLAGA